MSKKNAWKRIAAWILTVAMITGSNSFAVLAEELAEVPVQEAVVQETAAEPAEVSLKEEAPAVEEAPAEIAEIAESTPEEIPAEAEVSAEEEIPAEAPAEAQETVPDSTEETLPEQETGAVEAAETPSEEAGAGEEPADTAVSDDEEIIIGDEGLEQETLPEDVGEAITMALMAESEEENSDRYYLEWQYRDDSNWLLNGESMTVGSALRHEFRDENNQDQTEMVDAYTLKLVIDGNETESYTTEYAVVKVVDGNQIEVTSLKKDPFPENVDIPVRAYVGDIAVAEENFYAAMGGQYVNIFPIARDYNPGIGETIDMNDGLQLMEYNMDGEARDVTHDPDYRVILVSREADENGYATDVWEVVEGTEDELIPTLRRISTSGTNFALIAQSRVYDENGEIQLDESGNECWEDRGSRNYNFGELGYDIWLDGNDLRGGDHTWVYTDEDLTIPVHYDELPENCEIEWLAGSWNEEANDITDRLDPAGGYYTVNEDHSITLHGQALAELLAQGREGIDLHVVLKVNGTEVDRDGTGFIVREPYYDYQWQVGDMAQLPNWDRGVDKYINCYVENGEYPYGQDFEITVTDIQVENDAESPDAVQCDPWEDGRGWNLHMNTQGHAVVTLTYIPAGGTEASETYSFEIWVGGDVWDLWLESSTDIDHLLPGASLDLRAYEARQCYDEQNGYYDGSTEGTWLEYEITENADAVAVEQDAEDPMLFHVTANEVMEDKDARIVFRLMANDEDGNPYEIVSAEQWIHIRGEYYQLTIDKSKEEIENLACGESITVTPKLWSYSTGQEPGSVDMPRQYRWEYDNNALEIKLASGNPDNGSGVSYTVKKLQNWDTDATLIVDLPDENGNYGEATRINLHFSSQNYDIDWRDGLRGGNHTWVFTDENLTIPLNTDNLQDKNCTVEWIVGTWDEEREETVDLVDPNGGYYTVNEDSSITLHGAQLAEVFNGDHSWANIEAYVTTVDGIEVSRIGTGVEVRETRYDYDYPLSDYGASHMLPNENLNIGSGFGCNVENAEYPWSEYLDVPYSSVEILGEGHEWDEEAYQNGGEQNYDVPESEWFISLEGNAEEGWRLQSDGEGFGFAHVRITFTDVETGKPAEYDFPVFVDGVVYEFNWYYSDSRDIMLPNSQMDITTTVRRRYVAEDGSNREEMVEDYRLSVNWDEGEPTYDTNLLEITPEGRTLHVASNENQGSTNVHVRALARDEESGEEYEFTGGDFTVNVWDSYQVLRFENMPEDIQPQVGETIDINAFEPVIYECGQGNSQGSPLSEEDMEDYRISLRRSENNEIGWDENAWRIVEGTEENLIPVLQRTGDWRTGITVYVEQRSRNDDGSPELDDKGNEIWREVCRRDLEFDSLGYEVYFDGANMRGGNHTWVFNNEDLTVNLCMENILVDPEKISVEWQIGTWNDETQRLENIIDDENGEYYEPVKNDGVFGIVLHGAKLAEIYNGDNSGCNLRGIVYVDGIEIWQVDTGVGIWEPSYEIEDDGTDDLLVGESFFYDNNSMWGFVQDARYPDGTDLTYTIRDIRSSDENVWKVTKNEEGQWAINAVGVGAAEITYDLTHEELGDVTYTRTKISAEDLYRVDAMTDTQTFCLLPGASLNLQPVVYHVYYDENGEVCQEFLKDGYTISYQYDDGMIELEDGRVTARDNQGETGVGITAEIQLADGSIYTYTGWYSIYIQDGYDVLEADEICVEPGQTVTLEDVNAVLKNYSTETPEGSVLSNAVIRFDVSGNPRLTVSEDGRSVTVSAPELTAEDEPQTVYLKLKAYILDAEGNPVVNENGETIEFFGWPKTTLCVHTWDAGVIAQKSTCVEHGVKVFTCTKCGAEYTEELPLAAHSWDAGKVTTQATCAKEGVKTYTCKVCKSTKTEKIAKTTAHSWDAGKITKKATCTANGVKTYTCKVCKGTKTEVVKKLGHNYDTKYTVDKKATCTAEGSKSRHCTRCGAKTSVTKIAKIAHKGGTATVLAQAKCSVCGRAYGSKLKPVLKVTANSLKMKVKQSTTAFKVTSMGKGDSVVSVTSSNTKVLKVSGLNKTKGTFKLTAQKKAGTSKLTIKLKSGLSKTITVTVQKGTVKTTSISGLPSSTTLAKGKTTTLKPVLAPVTSQQKVTYKSSNKKIVTVSSKGVIKAVKPGKATITVKSGSKSKKVTVVVTVKTTKITGVPSKATVKKGKTLTLKAKRTPSDSTEAIKYTTSNAKVATVSSKGVIKGVNRGTATITVTSGGKKVTCKVTVN